LTDFSGFLYKTLVNIVGPENASDRDFELEAYTRDLSSAPEKRASFVVRPSTTEQVASILKIANRYKVPVYIRGGGTSHWGEWLPLQGGILMDMSGLNQIIEIDDLLQLFRVDVPGSSSEASFRSAVSHASQERWVDEP
jgi:FAD/FMN-containing dehydrogenase